MAHRRFTHRFRRTASAARAVAALIVCGLPRLVHAQTSPPDGAPAQPYHTPAIALVQPASGGTVPQDKPVVVFRFSQGEADDQIDLRSFSVAVDGKDATPAFQMAASDAWGPLSVRGATSPIALGAHEVTAQLCSARGACGSVRATVTVLPPILGSSAPTANAPATTSLKRKILDAALNATRRLLIL